MNVQMIQLGGSLIPISFIGMGMVDIGKAIPKLRLRLPPMPLLSAIEPIEPRTPLYEICFFPIVLPIVPCYDLRCK